MIEESKQLFKDYPMLFREHCDELFNNWIKFYIDVFALLVCVAVVALGVHFLFFLGDIIACCTISGILFFIYYIKD